jgi:histidine triad (HIT) family protein
MSDCIFCKIVAGEIPCDKLFEDETTLAFVDITPVSLGHALVIPKAHHENLLETPDEACADIMRTVRRVAKATLTVTGAPGFNLGVNTGVAAGQVVMHTHFHIMPRHEGDGLTPWPKKALPREEMAETAAKVRAALAA